jgi:hypothetical protein
MRLLVLRIQGSIALALAQLERGPPPSRAGGARATSTGSSIPRLSAPQACVRYALRASHPRNWYADVPYRGPTVPAVTAAGARWRPYTLRCARDVAPLTRWAGTEQARALPTRHTFCRPLLQVICLSSHGPLAAGDQLRWCTIPGESWRFVILVWRAAGAIQRQRRGRALRSRACEPGEATKPLLGYPLPPATPA